MNCRAVGDREGMDSSRCVGERCWGWSVGWGIKSEGVVVSDGSLRADKDPVADF